MPAPRRPCGRDRLDKAMLDRGHRAQPLQALQMVIHRPRADVAAAGQGDTRLAEPGQQRPQHGERGAHLLDQFVRGFVGSGSGGVNGDDAVFGEFRLNAEVAQQVQQGQDIADAGNIGEDRSALRREARWRRESRAWRSCCRSGALRLRGVVRPGFVFSANAGPPAGASPAVRCWFGRGFVVTAGRGVTHLFSVYKT